ncbi:cadherin-like beta sandwich domain-containing protein [Clostridium aminobutyricum]|uniref:Cadherin-like beta sandwich domain-containing protein n=1 Tax=Clostridium aminobutyricum TaxID=33953 RepID=A0A939IJR6_CLOAM|nr:cadherin-like beta sandwich domain-containing protein [Clostridium aminobutyricum]MBN7773849.1 cadherin-like beta sandwich domain-containing protein [Clostridium aminobutyricum]
MKKIISALIVFTLVFSSSSFCFAASDPLSKLIVSKSESTSSSKQYTLFPEFDADITEYSIFLADGTDDAYLYMKPGSSKYTVYCDGDEVTDDDDYFAHVKSIDDGDEIDIVVKDDDDDKLETYTITFYCGDDDDNDEAALDDLYVKSKTSSGSYSKVDLNDDFDSDTKKYEADINSDYKTVQIYAEAEDSDATVLINGYVVGSSGYRSFDLTDGDNTFKITVIAENCDDTETYTLTLSYNDKSAYSSALSYLYVRDSGSNTITLSPAFSGSSKNYTTNVANSVKSVSVYATPTDSDSTLYINNGTATKSTWTECTLKEGVNTISVKVYQPDAETTTTTYNLNIYRQPIAQDTSISSQKLTVDGISKTLNAYNINGNNFVKLRDIASLISGSMKQFSVSYNEANNVIVLLSKSYYTSNGQENVALGRAKEIAVSTQSVYLDGSSVSLMTYNIDGNNYVMLRDVAMLFNFGLSYDTSTETVKIVTTSSYSN